MEVKSSGKVYDKVRIKVNAKVEVKVTNVGLSASLAVGTRLPVGNNRTIVQPCLSVGAHTA